MLSIDFIFIYFRKFFSTLFTNDDKVSIFVENILFIVAFFELFDGNQIIMAKALIAMGRQKYASWMSLTSFYVIMIPMASLAAFGFGWGLYGIWFGTVFSSVILFSSYEILLRITDWKKIIQESIERLNPEIPT